MSVIIIFTILSLWIWNIYLFISVRKCNLTIHLEWYDNKNKTFAHKYTFSQFYSYWNRIHWCLSLKYLKLRQTVMLLLVYKPKLATFPRGPELTLTTHAEWRKKTVLNCFPVLSGPFTSIFLNRNNERDPLEFWQFIATTLYSRWLNPGFATREE